MRWHVGIFYRIPDVLLLLAGQRTDRRSLLLSFPDSFHNVDLASLLDIAQRAEWLNIDNNDVLSLTSSGRELIQISELTLQLRHIINVLLNITQPRWLAFAEQGRAAVKEYAPPEAVQCLEEAGYFNSTEDEVVRWWDRLASLYRKERERENLETGRKGERKSFEYERVRTRKDPEWRSLEYANLGYDLISQVDSQDSRQLLIEVKATSESWNRGRFYLTKNEWNVLSAAEHAVVHLWSLAENPLSPSVVQISHLSAHIPKEAGEAEWEVITCPFDAFQRPKEGV